MTMRDDLQDWDVELDFVGDRPIEPDVDLVDFLLEALEDADGVVGFDEGALSIACSVRARGYRDAVAKAERVVSKALASYSVPASLVIRRLQVQSAAQTAHDALRPSLPEMMGVAEVASRLNVSKQRVDELRRAGRLPEPLIELRAGPIWPRPAIERFIEAWSRKPGRPRKVTA